MQAVCTKTAALLHLRTLLLLLMTHHEKTRLNVNRNRNPDPIGGGGGGGGYESAIPDFRVRTTISNALDIFRKWYKLNFELLRGHVKSCHFTIILLKGYTKVDNI